MSTLSITVSGPSASLAMLRALALKALGHAQHIWHTIKLSLTAASATARTASNLALAALGSRTGYELVLDGIRRITSSVWSGVRWCFSRSSRLLGHVARAGYSLISKVSPTAAKAVEDTIERFVVEPVLTAALTVDTWVCAAGRAARRVPAGGIGVLWVEGGATLHACSTGSAGLAAARLTRRDSARLGELRGFAEECAAFLTGPLRDDEGLVADHLRPDGSVEGTVWTYNQGLTIGLLAELGRVDQARDLAERACGRFGHMQLWEQPPAFTAILVRELIELHRVDGDFRWLGFCEDYLDRVWREARRPSDGLMRGGGIGHYDSGVVLDHAGLVGAMAALARAA